MALRTGWSRQLIGLGLGTYLAVLLWPGTGPLVRAQLRLALPIEGCDAAWSAVDSGVPTKDNDVVRFESRLSAILFFARANSDSANEQELAQLRVLCDQFPNEPAPYATMIRLSTRAKVRVDRQEAAWLTGDQSQKRSADFGSSHRTENLPADLAQFIADARKGEQLDPTNAFFPYMRAVGLFASRRDSEALAALELASTKTEWNDYVRHDLQLELRFYDKAFGNSSGLPRRAIVAEFSLPHLVPIRSVARVATALAAHDEQAGRVAEGLGIREAVRRCGTLLRVQSNFLIGNLIGCAVDYTSMMRPAGAATPKRPANISDKEWRSIEHRTFNAYLRVAKHAEAIPAFDAEFASGERVREITKSGLMTDYEGPVWGVFLDWIAGLTLLSAAVWMMLFAGIGTFMDRVNAGQMSPTLRRWAAPGIAAGPFLAGAIAVQHIAFAASIGLATVALVSAVPFLVRRAEGSSFRMCGAFGLGLAACSLLCCTFAWQFDGSLTPVLRTTLTMLGVGGRSIDVIEKMLSLGAATLIPGFVMGAIKLAAIRRQVPSSLLLATTLRWPAMITSALLLLTYAILIPFTVRQEAALNQLASRTVQHQGRFISEVLGADWPQ